MFVEGGFVTVQDPPTVRGPDLAWVREDVSGQSGHGEPYLQRAPDIAVEILSPSNRPVAMMAKVREYIAAGSRCVWVIDPLRRSAVVHHPDGMREQLEGTAVLHGGDVLPGFQLGLAALFRNL